MYHLFVNWIPTFHVFPEIAFDQVRQAITYLTPKGDDNGAFLYLEGKTNVGNLDSTVSIHPSGLFTIISDDISDRQSLTGGQIGRKFGEAARDVYDQVTHLLHVHMFRHRLFPINEPVEAEPQRELIVEVLRMRYFSELLAQQSLFHDERVNLIDAVYESAGRLSQPNIVIPRISWSKQTYGSKTKRRITVANYISTLFELLQLRTDIATTSETLYNCRGVESFYQAFCQLHQTTNRDKEASARYQEAYATLTELYREYQDMTVSFH